MLKLTPHREVLKEGAFFLLVITLCVILIVLLCQIMPATRRPISLAVQAVFSTLLAVPAGASWRSLRSARDRHRRLKALAARS